MPIRGKLEWCNVFSVTTSRHRCLVIGALGLLLYSSHDIMSSPDTSTATHAVILSSTDNGYVLYMQDIGCSVLSERCIWKSKSDVLSNLVSSLKSQVVILQTAQLTQEFVVDCAHALWVVHSIKGLVSLMLLKWFLSDSFIYFMYRMLNENFE